MELVKLTIEVLPQTKTAIERYAKDLGTDPGEVIDDLVGQAQPADPDMAALITAQKFFFATQNYDAETFEAALQALIEMLTEPKP